MEVMCLDKIETYMELPYEMSGSRSKNRFRLEMLWGVCKIFEIYNEPDFAVIFDYKCDIEIHLQDSLEFYQLKTHKVQSPYSFSSISKKDKKGRSVLGKLYMLKHLTKDKDITVKVALVSNAYFKMDEKVYSNIETLKMEHIDEASLIKIKKALQDEFESQDIDITNIHYIYTPMNLLEPENEVKGKITGYFEKIKNCEPEKPNALYRLIVETVNEKACYELTLDTYDDIVRKKGITKNELDRMLDKYVAKIDSAVEKTESYILENYQTLKERRKLKSALRTVFSDSFSSQLLRNKELEIAAYLNRGCSESSKHCNTSVFLI